MRPARGVAWRRREINPSDRLSVSRGHIRAGGQAHQTVGRILPTSPVRRNTTLIQPIQFQPTSGNPIGIAKAIGKDLSEEEILAPLQGDPQRHLVLSPIGAQGFVIGRGNLPLSPSLIRQIGAGQHRGGGDAGQACADTGLAL